MKSPAAYYLLLLYATVMFKPLIPFISDIWSHEFNEIGHISAVHAKYGSQHLQKEVADTGSENNQKGQTNLKSEDVVQCHISPKFFDYSTILNNSKNNYCIFNLSKPALVFISSQGPPPKFSL